MKRTLLLSILILCTAVYELYAQSQSAVLNANNTHVTIQNGGDFFTKISAHGYEIPKVTEPTQISKSTIFSGGLWIGGLNDTDGLHLSAMTYRQRKGDYLPGPVRKNQAVDMEDHDRMYLFNSGEIAEHQSNPSNPPLNILHYPGNGDTTNGEPWVLAPFVDLNDNSIYEPLLGDYPKILGDQSVYCLYNDDNSPGSTEDIPLLVDVHQQFFQIKDNHHIEDVEHSNFARFTIVNRSNRNYHDVYVGLFMDFDLGNYSDDYVGCDTNLNMFFSYNGDNNDEGAIGYGANPPAQGIVFLNNELSTFTYSNNSISDTSDIKLSLSRESYNLLCGKSTQGNDLYDPEGKITTRMAYGEVEGVGEWNESTIGNSSGDRRTLGAVGPFNFNAGESICMDVAFVYGRSFTSNLASVKVLKQNAYIIKNLYNQGYRDFKSPDCNPIMASIADLSKAKYYRVFPNPSTGIFTIEAMEYFGDAPLLINALGQIQNNFSISGNEIDLSHLSPGLYFLLSDKANAKLVVTR